MQEACFLLDAQMPFSYTHTRRTGKLIIKRESDIFLHQLTCPLGNYSQGTLIFFHSEV